MSDPRPQDNASDQGAHRPRRLGTIVNTATWARLQERAARAKERPEPRELFLRGLRPHMRAMPNPIASSSLFAPVAQGKKKIYKDVELVTFRGTVIKFWGEQLDESQADVWMQAMDIAGKQRLGEPVVIERSAFLQSINRHTGGNEYKWLLRTMTALSFAMLVIEVRKDGELKLEVGKNRVLHMILGFDYDEETGVYTLRIDPRWREVYGDREFSLIDWNKRRQFGRGQNMAKALQRLIATSADKVQRYGLEWLKDKLQYTCRIDKFRNSLRKAMDELERVGIIASGRLEISTRGKEQVVWIKL
ncbi:plasmid stabilization protein [Burkholderia pseudomallei]|uniref:plasmid stabilization protein n=1 Tax=Burkholderia pseudomallei TaxID=28450 RepID=UPI00128FC212|nr:plasmid stabilization protein [Burkholderia pseudomallei]